MSILKNLFPQNSTSVAPAANPVTKRGPWPGPAKFVALTVCLLLYLAQTAAAQPNVIATISFGSSRAGVIVANPANNHIYAAQEDVPAIAVIDGSTNSIITTIPTSGYHIGSDVNPVTNLIYVAQQFAGSVKIIDGTTDTVVTDLPVPGLIHTIGDLAINPTTNRLYVIRANNNDLAVFDAATNTFSASIPLNCPASACSGIALNPTTNRIYVAASGGDEVYVIDGGSNSIIATVPVGDSPLGIAVNPTTNRVYVSNISGNTVSVIDGATNTGIASISVGASPAGISVNPATNRIYVSNNGSNDVSVIDGSSNTVVATVPVGAQPNGITVIPSANRIYVANDTGHSVSVIEDLTDATPPSITPNVSGSLGNNDWYVGDVEVSWTITDPESGISTSSGCDPTTLTMDTTGETLTCSATNRVGLSNSASVTIKLDKTAPSITLDSPANGASYPLNATEAADYSCSDATAGIAACNGPVPSGSHIDTATVGAKNFSVNAVDNAGNSASVTHTYNVIYTFNGFFPPVDNLPALNTVKARQAIPVKFSLSGNQGLNIFEPGYPKSQQITCDSAAPLAPVEETVSPGGSSLTYDSGADQYIYVWKTEKPWVNSCRQLLIKLNDGTTHSASFSFSK